MKDAIVLDLETARSADDCRHCGHPEDVHVTSTLAGGNYCPPGQMRTGYERLGWKNTAAFGLSIGCYYDYCDSRIHWFDVHTLEETVRHLVETQPLLVSFNGLQFDFPLMQALLQAAGDALQTQAGYATDAAIALWDLCSQWYWLTQRQSYDILNEIWHVSPDSKYVRGINSLDAISQASGLGGKLSHGAQAPRDWRDGHYAKVLNYCQWDVYLTKMLFEKVCRGEPIIRGDGNPILLPKPNLT